MEEEKKGRRCDNGNFFHLLSFQITNSLLFLHMWEERGPQFRLFISHSVMEEKVRTVIKEKNISGFLPFPTK